MWVFEKLLPLRPHGSLRGEGFHRTIAGPECCLAIGNTKAEEHYVDRVSTDVQFKIVLPNQKPLFVDAAARWDQLNQVLECCRCGRIGHKEKIRDEQ